MSKFVREFGPEKKPLPAVRAANECEKCGKAGYAALPVMLRVAPDKPAETVFWKKQCVYCGAVPKLRRRAADGTEQLVPAFYMPYSPGRGFSIKWRDFYLPLDLYTNDEGKADVAKKVRLVAQIARLAEQNPTRSEFSWAELNNALDNV